MAWNWWGRRSPALVFVLLTAGLGTASGCGEDSRPPAYTGANGGNGGNPAGGNAGTITIDSPDGPPPPDASGFCGNDILPVLVEKPNLYFVLDASGSMLEVLGGKTLYQTVTSAVQTVLLAIGHRVNYGATIFPAPASADSCAPGTELFATREGDPSDYGPNGVTGPALRSLMSKLKAIDPSGGTPTASTLSAIAARVKALEGKSYVVLATDGAPNCNVDARCEVDACMLNMLGYVDNDIDCRSPSFNCCDPRNVAEGGYQCVDQAESVTAVSALRDAGIPTYVIGLPGTEVFRDVLSALAVAGGTDRLGGIKYYPTTSETELADSLEAIGLTVSVSCTVELGSPPPDQGLVNVYFDRSTVSYDEQNGWAWTDEDTVELRGDACRRLKAGDVDQVQVVAGCPTVVE